MCQNCAKCGKSFKIGRNEADTIQIKNFVANVAICSQRSHSFVANVAIQVAQPQVCYINSSQDAIDKKSSMCRRASEAAKTHLGVDIAGSSLFDAIGHLLPPAPSAPKPKTFLTKSEAPFKFTSPSKVTKPSVILKTLSPTNKPSKTVPKQSKTSQWVHHLRPSFMTGI